MKKTRKFLGTLLTIALVFTSMSMTAFAAEPEQPAVTENTTVSEDVAIPEVAPQANDGDEGIMPLGIGGYEAKYTNPLSGVFYVNAPGDGNGNGTFQITTHEFNGSPIVTAVLYRPDGTLAARILINGNGTDKKTFSNAVPGKYKIAYSVAGVEGGWISAWVSS